MVVLFVRSVFYSLFIWKFNIVSPSNTECAILSCSNNLIRHLCSPGLIFHQIPLFLQVKRNFGQCRPGNRLCFEQSNEKWVNWLANCGV